MCSHTAWLYADVSGPNLTIRYDGRYLAAARELENPSSQAPALALFLGNKAKNAALLNIFPRNTLGRKRRPDKNINLRVDRATATTPQPILFADLDPADLVPPGLGNVHFPCHSHSNFTAKWSVAAQKHEILDLLIARLLLLFTDVIVFFADDFSGANDISGAGGVKTLILTWAIIGSASSLPRSIRPRILVVTTEEHEDEAKGLLDEEQLRCEAVQDHEVDLNNSIASVKVVTFSKDLMPLARHRRLRTELVRTVDAAQRTRRATSAPFSAIHQAAFFDHAVAHTAATLVEHFDFIKISRTGNAVGRDFSGHLDNFLGLCRKSKPPQDAITSYIASSILVDAYPPGAVLFPPEQTYSCLYEHQCLEAFREPYESTCTADFRNRCMIKALCNMFKTNLPKLLDSHRETLQKNRDHWVHLKSNVTCLTCLCRKPEHVMACGHSLCDICVQRYGEGMLGFEHRYVLSSCIICQYQSGIVIKLKPPTAGVRILSIDGGGTRGSIPIETLSLLQDMAGPDCPIQEFFDLAFGTSAGGLIVLSLFLQQWNVEHCANVFRSLTKRLFKVAQRQDQSISNHFRRFLRCWLSDGVHEPKVLETALIEHFGAKTRMFDHMPRLSSGNKVAVTATTITNASPVIFSNYNGNGARPKGCGGASDLYFPCCGLLTLLGYELMRPQEADHEPLIWQVGRATSAAPVLFPSARISPIGTFQDGGLKHNNPVHLALWESRRIWPAVHKPDVVVSLGTGTGKTPPSPKPSHARSIVKDGFVPRLYRSFMSSLDGQGAWRALLNQLDDQSRSDYFRLNIELPGAEPALDDLESVEGLVNMVRVQPQGVRERQDVLSALLISSLFFELDGVPLYESGLYRIQGCIRSRLQGRALIRALIRTHYPHCPDMAYFKDEEDLGVKISEDDVCTICYRYRRPVHFLARSVTEPITLSLRWGIHEARRLSGFPQSMSWFLDMQHLQKPFGNPTHDTPKGLRCSACRPADPKPLQEYRAGSKTKKRPLASSETSMRTKLRCVRE